MYCRSCSYSLQGLDGNRCPECGLIFDAADSRTFRRTKTPSRRVLAQSIAALFVLVLVGIGFLKGPDWWAGYKRAAAERQLRWDRALFDASKRGDVAVLTQCLAEGANPNYAQSPNLLTPLMAAAQNNHPVVIRLLLTRGANPNAVSRDGNNTTALMYAVEGDSTLESVKALVEGGADVNARHGGWGYSALGRAGRYNGTRVVAYLIERGADVNLAGSNGATPLAWAKHDGNDELAAILRRAGAKDSEAADNAVRKVTAMAGRDVKVERESPK
jgi:ankyrin repeat protein